MTETTAAAMTGAHDTTERRDARSLAAVILAAGKGTRMDADLPKVALPVCGRAMVAWVVDAAREVNASPIVLVVGHGADAVKSTFDADDADLRFVMQSEQRGTGHATQCAEEALVNFHGDVLVLGGDGPLIRPQTLAALLQRHRETAAAATLATSIIADPTGYGRIVRDAKGGFEAIVEDRNCTPAQREIHEINPSYYCFEAAALFDALRQVERNPASGEYYLTDVPGILKGEGRRIEVIDAVPAEDVLSINTPHQLAEVDGILAARLEACP